ncbi:hypothetical protein [Yersinia proxima]|uniref:hypothetical protein n=1 Tax=Yersinia proxima TaxID=2890316 RepID=UPI001D12FD39
MQKIGDIPNTRADNNGEFTDGNVAGGVPPTILPAEWFNTIQRELISILTAADIEPDSDKFDQVATAVSKLITDGGFLKTANNLVEIKNAGAAAIATTLSNLGLSDVAHLPQLTGVIGTSRNAKMSVTAASATATFTADELIVQTALGGRQYKLSNLNKTINTSTTGAGGMDVGAAPASGFLALYAIYNPATQTSALLAVNATSLTAPEVYGGANMPSGYTASALVSIWKTTSTGQLDLGRQRDRHVDILRSLAMSVTDQQTSLTQVAFATLIPRNAKSAHGDMQISTALSASTLTYVISPDIYGIGAMSFQEAGGTGYQSGFNIPIAVSQTISYRFTASAGTPSYSIYMGGYEF